jgi:hypothetical protein
LRRGPHERPTQRGRLVEIRDNLEHRVAEVHRECRLGEIEGLQIGSLARQ